jgi:formylglycine-generating enzyme required for sulfatase activity
MKFTWIPPGSFQMGSPPGEEGRNINETRHRVTLTKGFYLGIYEVTRGQYAGFVKATGYQTIAERKRGADFWTAAGWQSGPKVNWQAPGFEQTDNHPVVCLGWSDAIAFADWVSTQDRAGRRYRLPTEAEWEYACRAGEPSAYCSGNTPEALKKVGWCSYDKEGSAGGTKSVGQFQPNAWGLYDMHGNAWEWCQDWFEEYSRSDQNEPAGPVRGSYRVFRGGCWLSPPRECRSAMRGFRDPEDRGNHLGCRLVMVPAG